MKAPLVLLAAATLAGADVPAFDRDGTYPATLIWLEGGPQMSVASGDVPGIVTAGGTVDQELDGGWQAGGRIGIEVQRVRFTPDGHGWSLGCALGYEEAHSNVVSTTAAGDDLDRALSVHSYLLTLTPGYALRLDGGDDRITLTPRAWQLDLGPLLAVGATRVLLEGSDASAWGWSWQAGLRTRLSYELSRHWRAGITVAGFFQRAYVSWDNTGDAAFEVAGVQTLATIGWQR
jgi:hypothetical protein